MLAIGTAEGNPTAAVRGMLSSVAVIEEPTSLNWPHRVRVFTTVPPGRETLATHVPWAFERKPRATSNSAMLQVPVCDWLAQMNDAPERFNLCPVTGAADAV